jgi:hypothetical protein
MPSMHYQEEYFEGDENKVTNDLKIYVYVVIDISTISRVAT